MRKVLIVMAAAMLASCGDEGGGNGSVADNVATADAGQADTIAAAKAEAAKFHTLMDAGQAAEIYKTAYEGLRGATPEQAFVQTIDGLHAKLGKFQSAPEPIAKADTGDAGPQISLTYDSVFENGALHEVFTYVLVDGKPQLGAYDYKAADEGAAPAEDAGNGDAAPEEDTN